MCTAVRGAPALVYNSDTVNVHPMIAVALESLPGDVVPTSMQAQLTWNNGTPQSWVTFSTSGHAAGGAYWLTVQVNTAVKTTGVYPWKVEVQATLPNGGGIVDRTVTGIAAVVANDSTTAVDPFGPGWSVSGDDRLLAVSASSGVPAGVLWIYGSGEARFFQSLVPLPETPVTFAA
jgi:hypothetical protein